MSKPGYAGEDLKLANGYLVPADAAVPDPDPYTEAYHRQVARAGAARNAMQAESGLLKRLLRLLKD